MSACDLNTGCELERMHAGTCPTLAGTSVTIPKEPWNEIAKGLWQGSSIQVPYREEFDAILTLYRRAPRPEEGIKHVLFLIPDAGLPDLEQLDKAVAWVREQWLAGRRVLVRCQAGLNRSGLVVARVLLDSGAHADETIHLIRTRRSPYALCNPIFEQYVRTYA